MSHMIESHASFCIGLCKVSEIRENIRLLIEIENPRLILELISHAHRHLDFRRLWWKRWGYKVPSHRVTHSSLPSLFVLDKPCVFLVKLLLLKFFLPLLFLHYLFHTFHLRYGFSFCFDISKLLLLLLLLFSLLPFFDLLQ